MFLNSCDFSDTVVSLILSVSGVGQGKQISPVLDAELADAVTVANDKITR